MSAKPEPTDYTDQGVCHPCERGDHAECYEYGCECSEAGHARPFTELTAAEVAELEEDAEAHFFLCEQLGEMTAEHRGEVARFGDSWPGAQLDLAHLRGVIDAIELRLDTWPEFGPPIPAPYLFNPTTNEEPF
jgi:hypothetical protein